MSIPPLFDRCLDSILDAVVVDAMLVPRIMHCAGREPEMDTHLTQHRVAVANPRSIERVALPASSWSATPRAWFASPHDDVVVEASPPSRWLLPGLLPMADVTWDRPESHPFATCGRQPPGSRPIRARPRGDAAAQRVIQRHSRLALRGHGFQQVSHREPGRNSQGGDAGFESRWECPCTQAQVGAHSRPAPRLPHRSPAIGTFLYRRSTVAVTAPEPNG